MRTDQSIKNRRSAEARWLAVGVEIPHDTDDLRQAIKREVWTRGLTLTILAERMGMNLDYIERCLSKRGNAAGVFQKIQPSLLNRIIEKTHITPCVAKRLHLLAAREHGWQV